MKERLLSVLPAAANADAEFALAARMWDADVVFSDGGDALKMVVRDGVVRDVAACEPGAAAQIRISGAPGGWEKLLMPIPPAFYQDLFGAAQRHDFVLEGRIEDIGPYYPALRRVIELARGADDVGRRDGAL
jgi:hypothetical protein